MQKIPEGKHKEEMGQIFEVVGQHIERGDHVIINITNGFSSLSTIMISTAQVMNTMREILGNGELVQTGGKTPSNLDPQPSLTRSKTIGIN